RLLEDQPRHGRQSRRNQNSFQQHRQYSGGIDRQRLRDQSGRFDHRRERGDLGSGQRLGGIAGRQNDVPAGRARYDGPDRPSASEYGADQFAVAPYQFTRIQTADSSMTATATPAPDAEANGVLLATDSLVKQYRQRR